jgi:hypothetical protein
MRTQQMENRRPFDYAQGKRATALQSYFRGWTLTSLKKTMSLSL